MSLLLLLTATDQTPTAQPAHQCSAARPVRRLPKHRQPSPRATVPYPLVPPRCGPRLPRHNLQIPCYLRILVLTLQGRRMDALAVHPGGVLSEPLPTHPTAGAWLDR